MNQESRRWWKDMPKFSEGDVLVIKSVVGTGRESEPCNLVKVVRVGNDVYLIRWFDSEKPTTYTFSTVEWEFVRYEPNNPNLIFKHRRKL
jgi:hypothetical protein